MNATHDQAHELLWQALELIHDAGADTDTCTVANGMVHEAGRLIGHKRAAIALAAIAGGPTGNRGQSRPIARVSRRTRTMPHDTRPSSAPN